ncbi:hypothetical protein COX08_00830 [Candidatus Beckwithbacteria bacterium CG23_combo_of_CG06-09_8_20_14_all_34_8]|uniref:Uncharacterized protein n=1 Tax=Candidatus Beckwithbacteria bacterium CG23_combo_of_CG06-09_8_20_14_all_34_8 TaxID=1974497 RepID=A0A2H0B744_9BACT|nr:MAG: hypothetical protein COX08_00830 [Candidatus Beckwithbacteria bacterium CG23_combo_of_CG06-09_8_20_14_all_34_8]
MKDEFAKLFSETEIFKVIKFCEAFVLFAFVGETMSAVGKVMSIVRFLVEAEEQVSEESHNVILK